MEEKCIEIILDSVTVIENITTKCPSTIKLYSTHAEFYIDFKYNSKYKIDTGDEILDKINPQYKETKEKIKQTIFVDKFSILSLSVNQEDSYAVATVEAVTSDIQFTMATYKEAEDFIIQIKKWRYGY